MSTQRTILSFFNSVSKTSFSNSKSKKVFKKDDSIDTMSISSDETFNISKEIVIIDSDEVENDVKPTFAYDNISTGQRVDDVTYFFFNIVERFLNDENLKNLFNKSEIKVISTLYNIKSDLAKQLFVHVYWLQPTWHKISKITIKYLGADHFETFGGNSEHLKCLLEKHLFIKPEKLSIDEYASMLTLPELCDVAKYFKIKTKGKKESLIEELKKCNKTDNLDKYFKRKSITETDTKRLCLACQDYVKIDCETRNIFDKLHVLMYLGTNPALFREKKLNLMLINIKNKKQHYPCFSLDVDSPSFCFPNKTCFDEFISIYMKTEEIIKLTTKKPCNHQEVINISGDILKEYTIRKIGTENVEGLPPWNKKFTAHYQCIRGLEMSINSFKSLKSYDSLLNILSTLLNQKFYRKHKRALWYDEKLLILQKRIVKKIEFVDVLCQALEDTLLNDDHKAPLKDRALGFLKTVNKAEIESYSIERLKNLLSTINNCENVKYITIIADNVEGNTTGQRAKYTFKDYVTNDKYYVSVEDCAILHYCNHFGFSRGEHWEGRIITSIFSLLFWDIIYSQVPEQKGIFINKYQETPLDMYSEYFYKNRKTEIDKRLNDIQHQWSIEETVEVMTVIHESIKEGTISLYNDNIDFDSIKEVVLCLGSLALYNLLRRLATSYHYTQSGFPDITVWNVKTKMIKFVEVKGIGDRPSFKQIQWISYMHENQIESEICYVENSHSKKILKKRDVRGRVLRGKVNNKSKMEPELIEDENESSSNEFTQPELNVNQSPTKKLCNISPSCSQSASVNTPIKSPKKSPRSPYSGKSPFKMSPKARRCLSLTKRRLLDVDK